jgi:hypothetical protein
VIDPADNFARTIPAPGAPTRCVTVCWTPFDIGSGGAGVWETANLGTARIDPSSLTVTKVIDEVAPQLGAVAVGDRFVWVIEFETPGGGGTSGGVYAFDLQHVAAETALRAPIDVASDGPSAWVLGRNGEVWHVNTAGQITGHARLGAPGAAVTTGDGYVWVALENGDVLRVDPTTLRATVAARLHRKPSAAAFGAGRVWVTVL